MRICSAEYLDDEIQHIISSFMKLKYPKGFLLHLKKKASEIRNETRRKKEVRYISIPNSNAANHIARELETTGVRIAFTTGRKIGEMIAQKGDTKHNERSVVYQIPCGSCDKSYIEETGRGMGKTS